MALPLSPFVSANSIFAGKSVIQLKLVPSLSGVTSATTVITTLAAHGLVLNQGVVFVSGTGFTGLTAGVTYYVVLVGSTTTFSVSATIGGSAIAVGTSSAGVFQAVVVVESRKLDSKAPQENKDLLRPDAAGVMRKVRIVRVKGEESFEFEMDEAKRLLSVFSGGLSGLVVATATLWLPDPADAVGNVALKSEVDFPCIVYRTPDLKFGDADFTRAGITIESTKTGQLVFTADGLA